MAEIGLDILDDEIDDSDPYKRRVAILVVAIALFGSIVALMENRAGNREEVAARETQRLAVSGLGSRVTTDARVHTEQGI